MKYSAIALILVVLFCAMNSALAAPDSLHVRQVDFMDAVGQFMSYGPDDEFFFHNSKAYWDLAMGAVSYTHLTLPTN